MCVCGMAACVYMCMHTQARLPVVELAEVRHVAEDDGLLAGHRRWHVGAVVQVLHVVALQKLQLAHKGLLRGQQLLDDGAGGTV